MKRFLSLLLVLIMTLSIVACTGDNIEDGVNNNVGGGNNTENEDNEGAEGGNNSGNTENSGNTDPTPDPEPTPDPDPTPEPTPDPDPTPGVTTVYLLNRAGWEQVAVYYWGDGGEIYGGWPGEMISLNEDGFYRATVSGDYSRVIFNNNNCGAQTPDLSIPTDDRVVYDNVDNKWLTYEEAFAILYPGYTPNPDPVNKYAISYDGLDGWFIDGYCPTDAEEGETVTLRAYPITDADLELYANGVKINQTYADYDYWEYVFTMPGEDVTITKKVVDGFLPDPTPDPEPTPDYPADELEAFNALFNLDNHISIELDISNSELKKIQQDYEKYSSMGSKSPIYRMADMIITITEPDGNVMKWTIEQVGVRMKGNTSRTSFYADDRGMYNLIHFKISFQETFDDVNYYGSDALTWTDAAARKARKDRTFATLEKIDMRWNRNDDTTYIREIYAYELYRSFGVLAPHTNLASVDVGNDHAGVWVIYEPIDKIFLEKNLPESALGGDLYKLGWTNEGATFTSFTQYGVEDEDNSQFFVYDLKTNKKTSTHDSLKNFINTIKSSSASKTSIENILDVENFLNYAAVSYMIGNPDDLRNNYNNSYIYFRPDTGKMIVIPYDMDRGLGVNTWNPSGHGMTKDDPYNKKAYGNGDQRSPLFLKTVCTGGYFVAEYTEALKRVDASEMLTNEKFAEWFNTAAALYSSDASTSKTYDNAGWCKFRFDINRTCGTGDSSNMSFADYLYLKRETLYNSIGDQGNNQGSGPVGGGSGSDPATARPYVMGDMNGWQVNESYAMTAKGDGTFTFTLTADHVSSTYNRIKFKIMDDSNGAWYGYEIADPNCTVNYNDIENNSNGNKNFYLAPGSYLLTFDANTGTLYIEAVE